MRTGFSRLAGRVALVGALAAGGAAHAGPWAREKGQVFAIVSGQSDATGESWTGIWAEYGLTSRITLGLDGGVSGRGDGKVIVWGQKSWEHGEHRFAASMGLGASLIQDTPIPLGQVGLGWGRGISTRFGPGWLSAEGRATMTTQSAPAGAADLPGGFLLPENALKAEFTLGLRPRERLMLINQLRFDVTDDSGLEAELANSVVFALSKPTKVEVGLTNPIVGEGEAALKVGLWLEF